VYRCEGKILLQNILGDMLLSGRFSKIYGTNAERQLQLALRMHLDCTRKRCRGQLWDEV
jgi:hypothetical protein